MPKLEQLFEKFSLEPQIRGRTLGHHCHAVFDHVVCYRKLGHSLRGAFPKSII